MYAQYGHFIDYVHNSITECLVLAHGVQMERASLRLEGVKYLLEVIGQQTLLPSVQYAVLCGWLGLTNTNNRYIMYIQCVHVHGTVCVS